jgi:hypothetical protein
LLYPRRRATAFAGGPNVKSAFRCPILLLFIANASCGTLLSRAFTSSGVDRATARAIEPDARAFCDGRACEGAPLERVHRDRPSKLAFTGGLLADASF